MEVIHQEEKEATFDADGKEIPAQEPEVKTRPDDPNDWAFWNEKCYVRVN